MILLEIDKKYPHNERLLGEHRWSEFLKKPNEEEEGKVTQVFHSLYSKGRDAQKDGWKRIHVEAAWFKDWDQFKRTIQDPYPGTYWCPTPPEDRTNKPLCRPLPVKDKAPPERPAPPVVGSANWVSAKTAPSLNTPRVLKSAWGSGKPGTSNIPERGAWNKPILPTTTSNPSSPASATSPTHVWNKPIALVSPSLQSAAYPPGLGPRQPSTGNDQTRSPVYPTPPGLTHSSSSSGSNSSSGTSFEGVLSEKPLEGLFEDAVTISLSPSQNRLLYGTVDVEESPEITETGIIQPWEQTFVPKGIDDPVLDSWDNKSTSTIAGGPPAATNLWGEDESAGGKKPPVKCPHHPHECRKGICQWRADYEKDQERLRKEAERQDGFSTVTRGGRGNGRRGKDNRSGRDGDGASVKSRGSTRA